MKYLWYSHHRNTVKYVTFSSSNYASSLWYSTVNDLLTKYSVWISGQWNHLLDDQGGLTKGWRNLQMSSRKLRGLRHNYSIPGCQRYVQWYDIGIVMSHEDIPPPRLLSLVPIYPQPCQFFINLSFHPTTLIFSQSKNKIILRSHPLAIRIIFCPRDCGSMVLHYAYQ